MQCRVCATDSPVKKKKCWWHRRSDRCWKDPQLRFMSDFYGSNNVRSEELIVGAKKRNLGAPCLLYSHFPKVGCYSHSFSKLDMNCCFLCIPLWCGFVLRRKWCATIETVTSTWLRIWCFGLTHADDTGICFVICHVHQFLVQIELQRREAIFSWILRSPVLYNPWNVRHDLGSCCACVEVCVCW